MLIAQAKRIAPLAGKFLAGELVYERLLQPGSATVVGYQSSVRNGEAGMPSLLYRLAPAGFIEKA